MGILRWKRKNTDAPESRESKAERKAKHVYQVLLIVSLVGNGALAVHSQISAERVNELNEQKIALETKKLALETDLATQKSSPTLIVSRVRYDAGTFLALVEKNAVLPFLQNVKDYRIVENRILGLIDDGLDRGNSSSQIGKGVVTFLVVANIGEAHAFQLSLRDSTGRSVSVGDLLSSSAVLLPMSYRDSNGKDLASSDNVTDLSYQMRIMSNVQLRTMKIPEAVAETWTPAQGKLRSIGRAAEGSVDLHLQDILPKR